MFVPTQHSCWCWCCSTAGPVAPSTLRKGGSRSTLTYSCTYIPGHHFSPGQPEITLLVRPAEHRRTPESADDCPQNCPLLGQPTPLSLSPFSSPNRSTLLCVLESTMSDVATDDDEYYDPPSARCPAPLAAPGPSRFIPRPPSPPPITLGPAFTVLAASQVVAPSQIPPPPHRIDPLISLERPAADAPLELLVLGSGSSGAVPDISCVTSPQSGCEGCLKTLSKNGAKNVRGNTGVVIRVPQTNGEET